MKTAIIVLCISLLIILMASAYAANPYGIAGNGYISKVGLPAGALDYNWNWVEPNLLVQMVRPNHYYNYIGMSPQWFHYNELTDQINDPVQFSTWVAAHPGKIWIIGNEPDLIQQDGLTKEQYVKMYKKYYDLIKPIDPTAKFCIGAMSGGTTAAALVNTKNWYQGILDLYKQQYGVDMPIDIWNVHTYCGPTQIEDPDKIINEYITPFVNWCHTVQSGVYAGCEVWITELPIGEWMGAVSPENFIWFMQKYLPRLEQAGISRWFWYVSMDWDGYQGSCPLADKNGQVTPVGNAYAALANSYPNPIPAVTPFVPNPTPGYASYDFSGTLADPWFNKGGNWSFTGGELRHTGIYMWWGTTCALLYTYGDSGVSFRMKINSTPDPLNWGGVLLRVANRFHTNSESGYLFFVRMNGEACLWNKTDGVVASMPGAVADPQNYHDYRITIAGNTIKVWIDGTLKTTWIDANRRFTSGYTVVQTNRADVSFDDFNIIKYSSAKPAVTDDGTYTTDFTRIHASWRFQDPGCGVVTYKYAVGLTSGATDVVPWTDTDQMSIDIPVTLTIGRKYYISVKAIYPAGFESLVGTSDGIVAAASAAGIKEAKGLPESTFATVQNKVISAVFPDSLYIQEPDRSNGIRVQGKFTLYPGNVVTFTARTALDSKELVLQDAVVLESTAGTIPKPLLLNNRSTGGSASGLQPAPMDDASIGKTATGLSNVGLLVKTTGKVTYVDPDGNYAYIDDGSGLKDGSGHTGIRVSLVNTNIPAVNASSTVIGCLGAMDIGGNCARILKPRTLQDASFSALSNYLLNAGFEKGSYVSWTKYGSTDIVQSGEWTGGITPHSGSFFFGNTGNGSTRTGGLYQRVAVPAGKWCGKVWSCIYRGGNTSTSAQSRVGIDPTGGISPYVYTVKWSPYDTQPTEWLHEWHELTTPVVTSSGGYVTIFIEYKHIDAAGTNINCFDDVKCVAN